MTPLDKARHLVRLAALSSMEEEARTAAVSACRLIVREKILLSTEDAPDDTKTLAEIEEAAREAIDRLRKKREELGMPPEQLQPEPSAADPFGGRAQSPPREPWMVDFLFSTTFPRADKCRTLGCRGNKPCVACEAFLMEVVRRAINKEVRDPYLVSLSPALYRMLVDYFARSFANVVKRKKPRVPKKRRLAPKLRVIEGGSK